MVKKAILRASIPFTMNTAVNFNDEFRVRASENGWKKTEIQGSFLLKHINTSFEKNTENFTKRLEGANYTVRMKSPADESVMIEYTFSINEIYVYCFDTGVGIITFHIPYDNDIEEEAIINTCSLLRCSAKHESAYNGVPVFINGEETYLSCIADSELKALIGNTYTLFDNFNANSMKRVDMFSAVLSDQSNNENTFDRTCYLLSNTLDTRDSELAFDEKTFYKPQKYTRWSFSKRGCSAVSNLTGMAKTDSFLTDRWFGSIQTNYFYTYLMILHQKYAIYNYLNTVASDTDNSFIKFNQESLIDFNSKYVFTIVSDENFIQSVYLRIKDAVDIDEVYTDLLDELKRMFEYSQLKTEESNEIRNNKLNIISVIISILCSITIIFDTINMFAVKGILCMVIVALEVLLFAGFFVFVMSISKKKK